MNFGFYDWIRRFQQQGLTSANRSDLRTLLSPKVILSEPIRWKEVEDHALSEPTVRHLVNWEITLAADDAHFFLKELAKTSAWREALPEFLTDGTELLREALDLMQQLDGANDKSDLSYLVQPSISPHPQNRDYRNWTALIEITRDAWIAMASRAPDRARSEVERWHNIHYPIFTRLTFFAATETELFSVAQSLGWLTSDNGYWLWSPETEREAMRLLVALAPKLTSGQSSNLFHAILRGPPPDMYRADIELERFNQMLDREVWLRLEKCKAAGAYLPADAAAKLNEISRRYPAWHLEENQSDEFPYWMGEGTEWRSRQPTPLRRRELVIWLRQYPNADFWRDDDWTERCKNDFPRTASALIALAKLDEWPIARWRSALQVWSEVPRVMRSWRFLHGTLVNGPDKTISDLAHALAWMLQSLAKPIDRYEAAFFVLIERILRLAQSEEIGVGNDLMFKALNHPVGQVTDAAFRWWFRQKLQDDQGLLPAVAAIFSTIANVRISIFKYGRVLLGANLTALFRVDKKWTEQRLLPLFDWSVNLDEARAVWIGFLWSPRLYFPLLEALKHSFIETAEHYTELGECGRQYAALLAFVGLEDATIISRKELAEATSRLPADGLARIAQTLVQTLESAGEQRVQFWGNRIRPYLRAVWPKSAEVRTRPIEESFARLCIASGDAFPEAVAELRHWLAPLRSADFIINVLHESKLVEKFPLESFEFLNIIAQGKSFLAMSAELNEMLDAIREARPELILDDRFQALQVSARQRGV